MGLMEVYFSTAGRIDRSTYWLKGVLLLNVIWVVIWIAIITALVSTDIRGGGARTSLLDDILWDPGDFILLILFGVMLLAIYCWNNFAVSVKRLHDRDKSAWWLVLWWGCRRYRQRGHLWHSRDTRRHLDVHRTGLSGRNSRAKQLRPLLIRRKPSARATARIPSPADSPRAANRLSAETGGLAPTVRACWRETCTANSLPTRADWRIPAVHARRGTTRAANRPPTKAAGVPRRKAHAAGSLRTATAGRVANLQASENLSVLRRVHHVRCDQVPLLRLGYAHSARARGPESGDCAAWNSHAANSPDRACRAAGPANCCRNQRGVLHETLSELRQPDRKGCPRMWLLRRGYLTTVKITDGISVANMRR